LRNVVKPIIELMAAMPSVVVGFLAALWLAPLLERNLTSFITAALAVPLGLAAAIGCWYLRRCICASARPGVELASGAVPDRRRLDRRALRPYPGRVVRRRPATVAVRSQGHPLRPAQLHRRRHARVRRHPDHLPTEDAMSAVPPADLGGAGARFSRRQSRAVVLPAASPASSPPSCWDSGAPSARR
jgi:hypothetical protein